MSSQTFTWNAYESALTGPITVGATTIALDSVVGLRDDGYLVIDPDDAGKREYILFTSITGSQLEGVARSLDGSAAGAQAHDAGTIVRAVFVHQMLDDLFSNINDIETWQGNHAPGTDPHPQYLEASEGNLAYLRLDGANQPGADIAWNNKRITNLASPTDDGDATNRGYVQSEVAAHTAIEDAHHIRFSDQDAIDATEGTYLPLIGGIMAGDIDMGGNDISKVRFVYGRSDHSLNLQVGAGQFIYLRDSDGAIRFNINDDGDIGFRDAAGAIKAAWDESTGTWDHYTTLDMTAHKILNVANGTIADDAMAYGQRYTDAQAIAAVGPIPPDPTGVYLPLTGGTLSGRILLPEGSVSTPAIALIESSNDTGLYGNDALGRVGITIEGGAAGDYIFSGAGFTSILSGKNLGDVSFPWNNIYGTVVSVATIEGASESVDVDKLVQVVAALRANALGHGDVVPVLT